MRNRRIAIAQFFAFFRCRTTPGPGSLSGEPIARRPLG
jgi:hypothetical protein